MIELKKPAVEFWTKLLWGDYHRGSDIATMHNNVLYLSGATNIPSHFYHSRTISCGVVSWRCNRREPDGLTCTGPPGN